MIAAVVPVKAPAGAKSRLLPRLGRESVERLQLAMLCDLLEALRRVRGLGCIGVVTPDARVARAAEAAGATALVREDPGLNPAIEAAAAELAPGAEDGVLSVLGDVPGARPSDLEQLLAAVGERGVALAPSNDGGTAALLRVPRDIIPAGFGPGSARRHRELAARAGVPFRELALPSLALDLDEPEDLDAFVKGDGAGARTRALLRELDWSGA